MVGRWPGDGRQTVLSDRPEILTGVDVLLDAYGRPLHHDSPSAKAMSPRTLERLLRLLAKYGVTRYDPKTGALELGPVRPAAPAEPTRPAPIDVRDPKSVDDFLRARLAPAGGSS
jgi:hypothetical protein